MIYFDYNSTAPYSPSVREYIQGKMANDWANPSSEHDAGHALLQEIKGCRASVAECLGCSTKNLIFTSGATESINTVLSLDTLQKNSIKTIISSKLEHHATLHRLKYLQGKGVDVLFVRNDNNGQIDFNHLTELCSSYKNSLVSLLYANNETGVITDLSKVVSISREYNALVHVDAVQALGKIQFDIDELDLDFASFSGHKIGALKGVGLLYIKNTNSLSPLIHGGGQEKKVRPGTYNYPAIKSFSLAVSDLSAPSTLFELRDYFEMEVLKIDGVRVNCLNASRLPNTSNIYIKGMAATAILFKLSQNGIFVSTGSACTSGSYDPSHVITGMGHDREYAESCLRISFGPCSSREGVQRLLDLLNN